VLYPKNFEQKIGFDRIRELLKQSCLSTMGHEFVDKIRFSSRYDFINKWTSQVDEFKRILALGEPFPHDNYFNLIPVLERLTIEGTYIEASNLFDLKSSLQTIYDCISNIISRDKEQFPELFELSERVFLDVTIIKKIEDIINDKGVIKDSASDRLKEIRRSIIRQHKVINDNINSILKKAKKNGWVAGDAELTVRGGRTVIPISATNKRSIKGFIHDESATGQTVFIEPAEVLEANNEIRELESEEKREIIKILLKFSDYLRPSLEDLKKCYRFLGLIDFIRAKAKFALEIDAYKPKINNKQSFEWIKARHPILFLTFKEQKKEVIPLDIKLSDKDRILVISGPNAGGKSVCMKTVALIQYMLQCGLLIPVESYSDIGIYDKMFIDIGDEQSLENDLSTYSSHLLNMKNFIQYANEKSIFFIDEMGTGTEPQLGGAIAEAALEQLNRKKSFGVVTTHYSNIKVFADKTDGVQNGAMLYDSKQMQPLYKLSIGKPGSSFAFEIAQNIGLQKNIINYATNLAGRKQVNFDRQLQDLELEKNELNKKQKEFKVADDILSQTIDKYEKLSFDIEKMRKDIINQAKREAQKILDDSNKLIENTIREIKESQANKERTREARLEMEMKKESLEKAIKKEEKEKTKPKIKTKKSRKTFDNKIEVGDSVKLNNQKEAGEVAEIKDKHAMVFFGALKMKVKLVDLEKVETQEKSKPKIKHKLDFNINEKASNFATKIDVRGKKAEEALLIVENYIDETILLGIREVKILHGKGDGILRHVIRQYLHSVREVKKVRDEQIEFGGQGITVVEL